MSLSILLNLKTLLFLFQIHEYSQLATQVLSANALKRSYFTHSNKRRRPLTSCHNVPPQYAVWSLQTERINIFFFAFSRNVDNLLNTIDRSHNDMTIKVWRPFATNAIVHVSCSLERSVWNLIIVCIVGEFGPCAESRLRVQRNYD